jgi:DNA-binding TFAR19-related protein (PDSD5 family)
MTLKEQQIQFEQFADKQRDIMLKKGNDYANEDRLSNFKMVAQIVGIPIEQVIGVFIATKTVRLGNLMSSGKKPDNESVEDNLLDLANYTQLLEMVRLDEDCKPTTGVLNGTSHIIVNNTKKEIIQ